MNTQQIPQTKASGPLQAAATQVGKLGMAIADNRPMVVAPVGKGAIVQAKIKNPFEAAPNDPAIVNILQEVAAYNEIGGYRITFPLAERKQALDQLALVERLIYIWFGNQRSHDLDAKPINTNMKVLMNRVLLERQSLVEISVNKNDDAPPVAGFDMLAEHIRMQVTQIWQHLLAGKGIRIEGDPAFRTKILTDFSRLLQTEMGRTLTGGIITAQKGLVILPTTMAKGKYVAQPEDGEKEGLEETDVHDGFVPVNVSGLDEAARLRLLQHIRRVYPESAGMSVTSEKGTKHYRFGVGTGSTLPVPIDSMDALPHASSRMANRYGHEVIAPTFINLGHELGHILRSAQGISAAGPGGKSLLEHGFEEASADRPEEFFNIGGIENRLRSESDLQERHGHGNLYSHWAVTTMDTIEQLHTQITDDLRETVPDSPAAIRLKSLRQRLDVLIDPIQALMNGKGSVSSIIADLGKIKSDYYFG